MTTTTRSSLPSYNTEGYQQWKPGVGITFNKGGDTSNSYKGVITALQEGIKADGGVPKAYPHNFAGIIAAIKDLETVAGGLPPVVIQPTPPGSIIDEDGDLNILVPPEDGDLWFDTRQGRLFVAIDKEWVQTNGADGLAYIRPTDNPPGNTDILPGQFWYDYSTGELYIFSQNNWVLISSGDSGAVQTTATLPLAIHSPKSPLNYSGELITQPDPELFNTQRDYNEWLYEALTELEAELVEIAPVVVGETKPANPKTGQLWYDTATLDMSVWYDDGDTQQWVPVSATYMYDEEIAAVRSDLSTETKHREQALQAIYDQLNSLDISSNSSITQLQATIAALSDEIGNVASTIDFSPYANKTTVDASIETVLSQLHSEIATVTAAIPNISGLAEQAVVNASLQALSGDINNKTTEAQVDGKILAALSAGNYINQTTLDTSLANLSRNYLTHAGGTLTGNLVVNKLTASEPALDFSSTPVSGNPAFKFQTVSADSVTYSTFGTSDKFYEYAWKFEDKEDFCWVYADTNKVFSITKDGPACSQLYLADFGDNGIHGRSLHNKIDVRDRLTKYQTAFETMRQGVANATDFDSLKANILTALASV